MCSWYILFEILSLSAAFTFVFMYWRHLYVVVGLSFFLYFFLSFFSLSSFYLLTTSVEDCWCTCFHWHTKCVSIIAGERGTSTWQDPAFRRDSLVPNGIRTRNPSKRAASQLRLGLRGHRDGPFQPSRTVYCTLICRITFPVRIYVIYMNKITGLHCHVCSRVCTFFFFFSVGHGG
jgi:hypothetical protein